MKKKRFDEIKIGKYFKYYGNVYVKQYDCIGINIKNGNDKFMFYADKVIPVIVTIKVKEK